MSKTDGAAVLGMVSLSILLLLQYVDISFLLQSTHCCSKNSTKEVTSNHAFQDPAPSSVMKMMMRVLKLKFSSYDEITGNIGLENRHTGSYNQYQSRVTDRATRSTKYGMAAPPLCYSRIFSTIFWYYYYPRRIYTTYFSLLFLCMYPALFYRIIYRYLVPGTN